MGFPFPVQKNRRSSSSLPLFLVFLLANVFLEKSVSSISALEYYPNGKQPSRSRLRRIQKYLAKINKPAVLSINSPDGDIIDCVDKWKQPAFDHPLLKNHTLRSAPSFEKENEKRGEEIEFSKRVPVQVWHLNGTGCPKDTVPIRRITMEDVLMAKSLRDFIRKRPNSGPPRSNMTVFPNDDDTYNHEYAVARGVVTESIFGMGATLNIWNPSVVDIEFSLAQIWLTRATNNPNELHSIEVGWQVYPRRQRGETATKLFIYWTSDGYRDTGCYNMMCPGFIRTHDFIVPGATMLNPYSTIDGPQYDAELEISEDFGNWWILYKGNDGTTHKLGYYPSNLLPLMREGANGADWGGEVVNTYRRSPRRPHTRTQMGSGRFAEEGFGRAAYFRDLFLVPVTGNRVQPETTTLATNSDCYTITAPTWDNSPAMGLHFYYGGPGGAAPNCRNN